MEFHFSHFLDPFIGRSHFQVAVKYSRRGLTLKPGESGTVTTHLMFKVLSQLLVLFLLTSNTNILHSTLSIATMTRTYSISIARVTPDTA